MLVISASHEVFMRSGLTIPLTAVLGALSNATSRACFHVRDLTRDLPDLVSKNIVNNFRVFHLVYVSLGCRGWEVGHGEMLPLGIYLNSVTLIKRLKLDAFFESFQIVRRDLNRSQAEVGKV